MYFGWVNERKSERERETRKLENVLMLLHKSDNPFIECFWKFPSNYSLSLFLPSFSFSLHRTWTQLKNTIWNESKYFCCQLSSHLILLPIFTSDSVFILLISYRWCRFQFSFIHDDATKLIGIDYVRNLFRIVEEFRM